MSTGDPAEKTQSASQAVAPRRPYPRNPIGVIALFVSFIEVVATISLKLLLDARAAYVGAVVIFIIGFPSLLSLLFFGTLWFRRESLYSPSDFREDASFVQLLARVKSVELRQKAAALDMTGDPDDVFSLIPVLLERGEIEAIITLGRGFLKVRRHSQALRVFECLSGVRVPESLRLQVLAFTAYSLNGLKEHERALEKLKELQRLAPEEIQRFWPALARSYSHLRLGNKEEFEAWLGRAKKATVAYEDLNLAFTIYPDLKPYLMEQHPAREAST